MLLWKRVVAALSLVAAALLAPTAPAAVGGAGLIGSRASHGQAVASSANQLMASIDGLVEGGGRNYPLDEPQAGGHAKPCVLAAWPAFPAPEPSSVAPTPDSAAPLPAFAPRSGKSRAPPCTSAIVRI
ncbi:MAG: hypothetical protein J2P50_08880 [Hyphomicrobiaceae bacterium]|nr:hypothetical protein [Hyphomicrobiaceae bacterium]